MIQLLAFFGCLAVIWAVPEGVNDVEQMIVGGTNTSISEVPYQVALTYKTNVVFCGGSILTPKYILTAAHCLKSKKFKKPYFIVRAGSSLHDKGGVVVQATRAVYHPKFSYKTYDYDVGIVELSTPLNFTKNIQPIKLVTSPPPDGKLVKISGWGLTKPPSHPSKWLLSIEIPTVNHKKCEEIYAHGVKITPRMICTENKGKSPCFGDSGGPVAYNGKLAGIVSFGRGEKKFPSVQTNTASEDIRKFIKQFVPLD